MAKDDTPAAAGRLRRYALNGAAIEAAQADGGLYLVATPIGNLGDISLRALELLAGADVIACEDTRVTRKLTGRYGIATPLTPYHEHNAAAARPKLLARLAAGQAVALVSDAGTPLISDPGYRLVRAACEAGHPVTALPGASATLAALSVAGLPTDRFFEGSCRPSRPDGKSASPNSRPFRPRWCCSSGPRWPPPLPISPRDWGRARRAICRELTKLHEEVRRGSLDELARDYAEGAETRGEIVIVVSPPAEAEAEAGDVDDLLRQALARLGQGRGRRSRVATGRPRREVYQRADAGQGERRWRGVSAHRRNSSPRQGLSGKAEARPEKIAAFGLGRLAERRAAAC